jgi:hypothetical protein
MMVKMLISPFSLTHRTSSTPGGAPEALLDEHRHPKPHQQGAPKLATPQL